MLPINISFEVAQVILLHYQFNKYDVTMNTKIVHSKEDTVLMLNVTNNRMIQASFNIGAIVALQTRHILPHQCNWCGNELDHNINTEL